MKDELTIDHLSNVFRAGLELMKQESGLASVGACVDFEYLQLALEELTQKKPKGVESVLTIAELVGVIERAQAILGRTH